MCWRWPVLTQSAQPSLPTAALSRPCGGSLSQEGIVKLSPLSSNVPSSTKNSPPPGRSSVTEVFGAQSSIRTSSRLSLNSGAISTPGLPWAFEHADIEAAVLRHHLAELGGQVPAAAP